MTEDLERTLSELGPGYREMVSRLKAPFEEEAGNGNRLGFICGPRFARFLLAASLTLALAVSAVFLTPSGRTPYGGNSCTVYTAAYAEDEFALRAILASQRADGSWQNDFLTRQNAAALRKLHDENSRIAYKRAVRYLRSKGLAPLSDEELNRRKAARG